LAGPLMNILPPKIRDSPALVRAVPFLIFVALTGSQGYVGETGRYWLYFLKTMAGAAMIWSMYPLVSEMRWKLSWPAVVAGIGVFVMWIKLTDMMRAIGLGSFGEWHNTSKPWNPQADFGSSLAAFFIVIRIAGSTLIVPPLEEVFYRSFVYRFVAKPDFQSVPIGQFLPVPFLVTSVLFGFEHNQWLAGILCGFVYQGLVCWKKRIGDAMTAHAITNFLLACWVVSKHQWHFW
jgi:CAAX prenyl protease-like protein